MREFTSQVTIDFRIPGQWSGPKELIERLPEGCRLTPDTLTLADGSEFQFGAGRPDKQFAGVFRQACRQANDEELAIVDKYTVNAFLCGPGGSMQAAHKMMQAAAALVRAGGAGVFIDNSALAHGGEAWLSMTEDGGPDAVSFAYVSIIRGEEEVWTMGMHTLGLRDVLMKRSDIEEEGFDIVEVIRYLAAGDKPIGNGHVLADLEGPRFQAFFDDSTDERTGSPMHNPFGRLKLVSVSDIADSN